MNPSNLPQQLRSLVGKPPRDDSARTLERTDFSVAAQQIHQRILIAQRVADRLYVMKSQPGEKRPRRDVRLLFCVHEHPAQALPARAQENVRIVLHLSEETGADALALMLWFDADVEQLDHAVGGGGEPARP